MLEHNNYAKLFQIDNRFIEIESNINALVSSKSGPFPLKLGVKAIQPQQTPKMSINCVNSFPNSQLKSWAYKFIIH